MYVLGRVGFFKIQNPNPLNLSIKTCPLRYCGAVKDHKCDVYELAVNVGKPFFRDGTVSLYLWHASLHGTPKKVIITNLSNIWYMCILRGEGLENP